MGKQGDERSEGTTPPRWWIARFESEHQRRIRANEQAAKDGKKKEYTTGVVDLGIELAELIGRAKPWNHSVVSNFINGERYTREMAVAFSILYGIPRFEAVVRAETEAQAVELELFLRKFERPIQSGKPHRVESVDQAAASLQEAAEDQIAGVDSDNEETHQRGRARRTSRRS